MLGQLPLIPSIKVPTVDVRNVAQAHLEAVLRDEANGKRFMLVGEAIWMKDMAESLKEKFVDYPVKTRGMYKWVAWVGSFFNS